jgi:uncharacterized protein YjbI with pentapeptide repeats
MTRREATRTKPICLGRLLAIPVLFVALVAGCGDGSDGSSSDVLSMEEGAARAFSEQFLAENPIASLQPGHIAIMQLEAAGTHDGDTGEDEGVDVVSYYFDVATELTISIDENAEQLGRLVVADSAGFLALEVERGGSEVLLVEPGHHRIELHHAFKSDPSAPTQMIFLRPEPVPAAASFGRGAQVASNVKRISAGQDCKQCDFSNSDLRGMKLDGLDLSDCLLHDAQLSGTSFACATMVRCQVQPRKPFIPPTPLARHQNVVFDGANLVGARFDGIEIFGAELKPTLCREGTTPARLDGSTWDSPTSQPNPTILGGGNFTGSSLVGASFTRTVVDRVIFDGADLTMTVFQIDGGDLRFTNAKLVETDMSGARLMGTNTFAGATLADVKMEGADFGGVSFVGANLSGRLFAGAVLDDADFSGVDFKGVDVSQADLSGAVLTAETSFAGATLTNSVDSGVNLSCDAEAMRGGCLLSSIPDQFKGADLSFANLDRVNLESADLGCADLDNELSCAKLNNTRLVGANLNFADLHGAEMKGAFLGVERNSGIAAATLRGAFMINIDLSDADLRSVDLSNAHLYGDEQSTLLVGAQLDDADLTGAIGSDTKFTNASLTNAVFNGAQLVNTSFDGADLANAKFDSAYLQGADFSTAANVIGASLSNAAVSTASGTWSFTEQDQTSYTYDFGPTKLGAFASSNEVTCPNDASGPCTGAKLMPVNMGPNPPIPPCVAISRFCWDNCVPMFDCRTDCQTWTCPNATCANCGS